MHRFEDIAGGDRWLERVLVQRHGGDDQVKLAVEHVTRDRRVREVGDDAKLEPV